MRRSTVAVVLAALFLTGGTTTASADGIPGVDVERAKAELLAESLEQVRRGEIENGVTATVRPLRASDCTEYPQLVERDAAVAAACASGTFVTTQRYHCTAAAGLTDRHLPFGFYVATMQFITNCGVEDFVLACYGLIAGVGVPPGGFGPGVPSQGVCFGATTPWISRHTQSYTAVVGLHTLLGGPQVAIFNFSH